MSHNIKHLGEDNEMTIGYELLNHKAGNGYANQLKKLIDNTPDMNLAFGTSLRDENGNFMIFIGFYDSDDQYRCMAFRSEKLGDINEEINRFRLIFFLLNICELIKADIKSVQMIYNQFQVLYNDEALLDDQHELMSFNLYDYFRNNEQAFYSFVEKVMESDHK